MGGGGEGEGGERGGRVGEGGGRGGRGEAGGSFSFFCFCYAPPSADTSHLKYTLGPRTQQTGLSTLTFYGILYCTVNDITSRLDSSHLIPTQSGFDSVNVG